MKIATKRPNMTSGRAAVLGLMNRFAVPGYRLSLLEVQKLAYFLQIAGEPLSLNFVKHKYGPYAETLHHVLQRLEGHFIRAMAIEAAMFRLASFLKPPTRPILFLPKAKTLWLDSIEYRN